MESFFREKKEKIGDLLRRIEGSKAALATGGFSRCPDETARLFPILKNNEFILLYQHLGDVFYSLFSLKKGLIGLASARFEDFLTYLEAKEICGRFKENDSDNGGEENLLDLDLLELDGVFCFSTQEELFLKKDGTIYRWQGAEEGANLIESLRRLFPDKVFGLEPSGSPSKEQEDFLEFILPFPWSKDAPGELQACRQYMSHVPKDIPYGIGHLYFKTEKPLSGIFKDRWAIKSICYHDDSVVEPADFVRIVCEQPPLINGLFSCIFEWLNSEGLGPSYEYIRVKFTIQKLLNEYKVKEAVLLEAHD